MSRIGKQPVPVPSGVDVTIDGQKVSVKGPKGALELAVAEPITVSRGDDGAIVVSRPDEVDAAIERTNRTLSEVVASPNYVRLMEHGRFISKL